MADTSSNTLSTVIFLVFVAFLSICSGLQGSEEIFPGDICISHTEGAGLGYDIGYTSLELFLSEPFSETLIPFADLRGHVFNNGKLATNSGLGLRYFSWPLKKVFGINAFYDYLDGVRKSYHQVGVGVEIVGHYWDVSFNGYLPVGSHKTNIYEFSYNFDVPGALFLLKAKEELALKGVDSLLRYRHMNDYFELSIGAGPYYYSGTSAKTINVFWPEHTQIFGGQIRANFAFKKAISLEGICTIDNKEKNMQFKITLCLPNNFACMKYLTERSYKTVTRNEIIVVETIDRCSRDPEIFDPEHPPL